MQLKVRKISPQEKMGLGSDHQNAQKIGAVGSAGDYELHDYEGKVVGIIFSRRFPKETSH